MLAKEGLLGSIQLCFISADSTAVSVSVRADQFLRNVEQLVSFLDAALTREHIPHLVKIDQTAGAVHLRSKNDRCVIAIAWDIEARSYSVVLFAAPQHSAFVAIFQHAIAMAPLDGEDNPARYLLDKPEIDAFAVALSSNIPRP
jgi:hypothetical protein